MRTRSRRNSPDSLTFRDCLRRVPRSTPLPTTPRAVLTALASHESPERGCWPSWRQIADEIGGSESTVERALKWLEKNGWLLRDRCNSIVRQRWQCQHGRMGGSHYHLNYAAMQQALAPCSEQPRIAALLQKLARIALKVPSDVRERHVNLTGRGEVHDLSNRRPTTCQFDRGTPYGTPDLDHRDEGTSDPLPTAAGISNRR